jgi:prevent-host-death family protein
MTTVTASKARANLYKLIDQTEASHEPIQITGKRGNAVLISEDDWRDIEATLHLSAIPGMVESIKKGMKTPTSKLKKKLSW